MTNVKRGRGSGSAKDRGTATPSPAAPSASIVVISPDNQILLLQRIQSGAFSAAHVFPGGNLSTFHEDFLIPAIDSPERHRDGPAYRLAAIRETFEESGVLLARPPLQVPDDVASAGRKRVERKEVRFADWLASVGGEADSDGLVPFTRWITPPNLPRRFTTQMYLYLMPLAADGGSASAAVTATADLTEVAAAEFAPASDWLQRAQRGEIILFPPQMYILALLAPILEGPAAGPTEGLPVDACTARYAAERRRLMELVRQGSGLARNDADDADDANDANDGDSADDNLQSLPWADLVISPRMLGRLPDGRTAMGLDKPGPELKDSGRRGDVDRVIVVGNFPPGPPRNLELRPRTEVMAAIRAATAQAVSREGKTRL